MTMREKIAFGLCAAAIFGAGWWAGWTPRPSIALEARAGGGVAVWKGQRLVGVWNERDGRTYDLLSGLLIVETGD